MTILDNMIRMLVDKFNKRPGSNNVKILSILSEQLDAIYSDLDAIKNANDLEQATGKTLDLIALDEGQQRGKANDEILRILIRARIARNNTDTSKDSVIRALSLALNTLPSNFHLKSLYSEGKPLTLRLEKLPLDALNAAGMTIEQLTVLLQELVGVDVGIESVNVEGTFRFSNTYDQTELNQPTGFSNVEQTNGGTLSGVYVPSNDIELPID